MSCSGTKAKTDKDLNKIIKPTKVKDRNVDSPTRENFNMRDILNVNDKEVGWMQPQGRYLLAKEWGKRQFLHEHDRVKKEAHTEKSVINKIVDHKINRNKRSRYTNVGEPLYRLTWYVF